MAARRAAGLVAAGARVTVIAPAICEDLVDLVAEGSVAWLPREATADDVTAGPAVIAAAGPAAANGRGWRHEPTGSNRPSMPRRWVRSTRSRWWLVHTATGDLLVDEAVARRADDAGIWCVRADRAEESAAHTPAIADGPDGVQVAVSGGGDPGRARAIRDAISDLLATGTLPLRRTRPSHAPLPRRPSRIASGSSGSRSSEPDAIRPRTQQTRRDLDRDGRARRPRRGWAGGSRADHRLRAAVAGPR